MSEDKPKRRVKASVAAPVEISVTTERKTAGENEPQVATTDERPEIRLFKTEPAVVGVEYGVTVNLGNYESARVAVSVKMPCYVEEINGAYEQAKSWVESRVETEVREIRSFKKSSGGAF